MPATTFGLLLVEGGDELAVCRILAGPAWSGLCGWKADSRDLPNLARLARNDPNFRFARSVGLVLDAENSIEKARELAEVTLGILGASGAVTHGVLIGSPRVGTFLTPDGAGPGAIETLCRQAVRDPQLAACVDQLVGCAGTPTPRSAIHARPRIKGGYARILG